MALGVWAIMDKMCCGFGHRDMLRDVSGALDETLARLIGQEGIYTFLTGGHGEFDAAFGAAVRRAKARDPRVRLWLIRPYFSNEFNRQREYYMQTYDDILVPEELAGVHYKAAVTRCNRWMIDRCEVVVSGIWRDFGGAYQAVRYARRRRKRVIDLLPAAPNGR